MDFNKSAKNVIEYIESPKSFTTNPRQILGLDDPLIADGQLANLTLFTLEDQTILTAKSNLSKSRNSPFFGKPLKGKIIYGVIAGALAMFIRNGIKYEEGIIFGVLFMSMLTPMINQELKKKPVKKTPPKKVETVKEGV